MGYSESTYVHVRKAGRSWRDSQIEFAVLHSHKLMDYEIVSTGGGASVRRPKAKIVVDGVPCVRFRLDDGRIAAVTEVYARAVVQPK